MESRQNQIYPTNLNNLLGASNYHKNDEELYESQRLSELDRSTSSPASTIEEECHESAFGVDLSGKSTNLGGKSFTIAAILGLTAPEDVMNLSIQNRFQNQRQFQSYVYGGHDMQRLNGSYCRSIGGPANLRGKLYICLIKPSLNLMKLLLKLIQPSRSLF